MSEEKVIYFYSYHEENGWLSNFHPSQIYYDGRNYQTAEHLYQAMKTDDEYVRWWISRAPKPYLAYKAGRSLRDKDGFDRARWEERKVDTMRFVLRCKFLQNDYLREKLLNTGDAVLHENSPTDTFWGVKGKDMLGKLLMEIREELMHDIYD